MRKSIAAIWHRRIFLGIVILGAWPLTPADPARGDILPEDMFIEGGVSEWVYSYENQWGGGMGYSGGYYQADIPSDPQSGILSGGSSDSQSGIQSGGSSDSQSGIQSGNPSDSQSGSPSGGSSDSQSGIQSGNPSDSQSGSPSGGSSDSQSGIQSGNPSDSQSGSLEEFTILSDPQIPPESSSAPRITPDTSPTLQTTPTPAPAPTSIPNAPSASAPESPGDTREAPPGHKAIGPVIYAGPHLKKAYRIMTIDEIYLVLKKEAFDDINPRTFHWQYPESLSEILSVRLDGEEVKWYEKEGSIYIQSPSPKTEESKSLEILYLEEKVKTEAADNK